MDNRPNQATDHSSTSAIKFCDPWTFRVAAIMWLLMKCPHTFLSSEKLEMACCDRHLQFVNLKIYLGWKKQSGHQRGNWIQSTVFVSSNFRLKTFMIKLKERSGSPTSSCSSGLSSVDGGRAMDMTAPGRETLDSRLFLTPLQLLGILKAHRLW